MSPDDSRILVKKAKQGENYDENKDYFYDPKTDTLRSKNDPTVGYQWDDDEKEWKKVTLESTATHTQAKKDKEKGDYDFEANGYKYDVEKDAMVNEKTGEAWRYNPITGQWEKVKV